MVWMRRQSIRPCPLVGSSSNAPGIAVPIEASRRFPVHSPSPSSRALWVSTMLRAVSLTVCTSNVITCLARGTSSKSAAMLRHSRHENRDATSPVSCATRGGRNGRPRCEGAPSAASASMLSRQTNVSVRFHRRRVRRTRYMTDFDGGSYPCFLSSVWVSASKLRGPNTGFEARGWRGCRL